MAETMKRKQAMARRLHADADSMDEKVQEAQRHVSHGMIQ